jgi:DNA-binding Lrp family transcriptional regulator
MMKINAINNKILQELSVNGKISNIELADKVGLSPSACLRRVQELESSGVITGYKASLNHELLGIGFIAYVMVGLNEHTKEAQEKFEQAIAHASEVKECHNVTGSFEYILRVETTDLKHYKTFHTDVLGTLPQVSTITTHVLMESTKDQRQ